MHQSYCAEKYYLAYRLLPRADYFHDCGEDGASISLFLDHLYSHKFADDTKL